jgi:cell division protein FtsW (lipid II flippase)
MAGFVGNQLAELRSRESSSFRQNPVKYVALVLSILVAVGVAFFGVLIGVRDMSPLLIIMAAALVWAWKVAPHPWKPTAAHWVNRGLIAVIVLVSMLFLFMAYKSPESISELIPKRERFMVWAEPERYPHSGAQVRQALGLAERGRGLGGDESWFGINANVMHLPAVQNDFIMSFILYKFGWLAGLILVFAQLTYIRAVWSTSDLSARNAESAGNYRLREAHVVLGLIIFGLIWVHILQWGISWGNSLGLIPVMGQPMTWISSANSHMICIGFPLLVLALISTWISKEVDPS